MWLPIPGYPDYDVSDEGQVRSRKSNKPRLLKTRSHRSGYKLVRLYSTDGQWKDHTVHSLVMLAFRGECPEGQCVRHRNSEPSDNSLSNLVYGTLADNQQDRIEAGSYGMKLTALQVKTIRSLHKFGLTHRQLSKLFSINRHNIGRIIRRQAWAGIK